MNKETCEGLARMFMERIAPWGGPYVKNVSWTTRKPYQRGERMITPIAVPGRNGVTLNAPWLANYDIEESIWKHRQEDCGDKPCGSGWQSMKARDAWRHARHQKRLPGYLSPWEPLLALWDEGAMIDDLTDTECKIIEYTP